MKLTAVRDLYATDGPFVTVYADVTRTSAQAAKELEIAWGDVRRRLLDAEVDAGLVDALGERYVADRGLPGPVRLTLVGSGTEVVLEAAQPGPPEVPATADVDLLPDLTGWLTGEDGVTPYAVVVVDRTGADLRFYAAPGRLAGEDEASGDSAFDTHVAGGGGEAKEHGHQSEETFRANADAVADQVLSGVRRHGPAVVVLAGEQQTRSRVAEALTAQQVEVVQTEAGGRGEGASIQALDTAVEEILARYRAAAEQDVLDRLENVHGAQAARGLDAVLAALVQGQVDTLVLDLDQARALTVDPADHPGLALPASVGDSTQPADRVLVAAAALTDAAVVLLPPERTGGLDGVHAVLRWS